MGASFYGVELRSLVPPAETISLLTAAALHPARRFGRYLQRHVGCCSRRYAN